MTEDQAMIRSLRAEVARLHQQIAALEQSAPGEAVATPPEITAPENWTSTALFQLVIDTIPDPICVKDIHHRWIACNQSFCMVFGYPREMIIGYSDPDRLPPDQARIFWEKDDEVFHSKQPNFNEEQATNTNGTTYTIWTRKFPLFDAQNRLVGLCAIATDISRIKQVQDELTQREVALQQRIIDAQQEALRELSTPLIPLSDRVILLPLIGRLDSQRAQQVLEDLLEGIAQHQASIALIDITGVQMVDTQVANALIHAARAVKLLGAQVVLTGIQPRIAHTLVELGVDLSGIITQGTLQAGIAYALAGREQSL